MKTCCHTVCLSSCRRAAIQAIEAFTDRPGRYRYDPAARLETPHTNAKITQEAAHYSQRVSPLLQGRVSLGLAEAYSDLAQETVHHLPGQRGAFPQKIGLRLNTLDITSFYCYSTNEEKRARPATRRKQCTKKRPGVNCWGTVLRALKRGNGSLVS
jgi:hypothetical protein